MHDTINIRQLGTFYDDEHYPRGFSKHGDFTISQAQALHDFGLTLTMLISGELEAQTSEEKHFVSVARGKKKPSSFIEKTWAAYQSKINSAVTAASPFGSPLPNLNDPSDIYDVPDIDDDEPNGENLVA